MVRVVLHERQRFLREALATALAKEPDVVVVGVTGSVVELLRLCGETGPDAAVVGLDADDVVDVATRLADQNEGLRIVGTHSQADPEATRAWLATGSVSAVPDDDGLLGILCALLPDAPAFQVAARPTTEMVRNGAYDQLTSREKQVMRHVAAGRGTKEIAEWLGISAKTVDRHKQNVFRKLGVQNQAHAVALAIRSGSLPAAHASVARDE